MIAGYGPRWLDNLLALFFDTVRSFPTVMFALAVVALVGPSLETVVFVVMMTSIPHYGRVARTQTLSLRNSEFIIAERAMGASMARILGIHVLPNILGVLAVLAAMGHSHGHRAGGRPLLPRHGREAADPVLGLAAEGRLRVDPPDPPGS